MSRVIKRGTALIPGAVAADWSKHIDWEKVKLEVSRGVQINILAREHADGKISYVQFWREYNKRFPDHPSVTMKLVRENSTLNEIADAAEMIEKFEDNSLTIYDRLIAVEN